eukprot:superscaffoldBa00002370_g14050
MADDADMRNELSDMQQRADQLADEAVPQTPPPPISSFLLYSIPYPTPSLLYPPLLRGISRARSEHSKAKLCHCKKDEISQSAVPAEWL